MSDIKVNTYNLKQYAERLRKVNSRVTTLDGRLRTLYTRVGLVDLINLIISNVLLGYSGRLASCQSYLNQTASDFELTENNILQCDPLNFKPPKPTNVWLDYLLSRKEIWNSGMRDIQRALRDTLTDYVGLGIAESALPLMLGDAWNAFWNNEIDYSIENSVWSRTSEDGEDHIKILTSEATGSLGPEYGSYEDKKAKKLVEQTKYGESNLPDEKWYDKKGTILEANEEIKLEGSVLDARIAGESDRAEGSIEAKFLTGEVHASAAAGLYVYEADKNGNVKKIFSPGVSAEVGTSVAVVQVEAEGRIGLGDNKNMLGAYGNVDAKVLSAEAKAKAAINRNEAYLGASAEADLVKVSASGGVSVLGTDIGVNGSLKVGVGAHAEVGYTDGKFKFDVGAAVGVGFDIGFEVDVSGTVDAVRSVASSAWEGAANTWNSAKSAVSNAWKSWFG